MPAILAIILAAVFVYAQKPGQSQPAQTTNNTATDKQTLTPLPTAATPTPATAIEAANVAANDLINFNLAEKDLNTPEEADSSLTEADASVLSEVDQAFTTNQNDL